MKYAVDIMSRGRSAQVVLTSDNPKMALEQGYARVKPVGEQCIVYVMNENGDVWRYWIHKTSKGMTILKKTSGFNLLSSDVREEIYMGARKIHNEF